MYSQHGMIRSLSAFSIDQFSTRLSTLNTKVAPRNTASARRTGTLLLDLDHDSADTVTQTCPAQRPAPNNGKQIGFIAKENRL